MKTPIASRIPVPFVSSLVVLVAAFCSLAAAAAVPAPTAAEVSGNGGSDQLLPPFASTAALPTSTGTSHTKRAEDPLAKCLRDCKKTWGDRPNMRAGRNALFAGFAKLLGSGTSLAGCQSRCFSRFQSRIITVPSLPRPTTSRFYGHRILTRPPYGYPGGHPGKPFWRDHWAPADGTSGDSSLADANADADADTTSMPEWQVTAIPPNGTDLTQRGGSVVGVVVGKQMSDWRYEDTAWAVAVPGHVFDRCQYAEGKWPNAGKWEHDKEKHCMKLEHLENKWQYEICPYDPEKHGGEAGLDGKQYGFCFPTTTEWDEWFRSCENPLASFSGYLTCFLGQKKVAKLEDMDIPE